MLCRKLLLTHAFLPLGELIPMRRRKARAAAVVAAVVAVVANPRRRAQCSLTRMRTVRTVMVGAAVVRYCAP
jgi:hypothetical protein